METSANAQPQAPTFAKSKTLFSLPVLLAVFLFLLQVLPFLSYRWVTDESWYAATGYSIANGQGVRNPAVGPNDLEFRFDARPPGTALVSAAAFRLFGTGEITARLGSVLAGLGCVLLTWWLAREIFGVLPAIAAALCLATDNFLVLTSRTERPESLTLFFVLLSLCALLRYARSGRAVFAVLAGLALAAGTMFHITLLGMIVSAVVLIAAIDVRARRVPVRGLLLLGGSYLAGLVPFAIWIITAPLGSEGFHAEFLKRAGSAVSLGTRLTLEARRYCDLFGMHSVSSGALAHIPLRLPIPLLLILFSALLWRWRRSWFYVELALLLPTALWLVYTVNKSSRYLVLLSPVFALVVAGAVAAAASLRPKMRSLVLAGAAFIVCAQLAANLYLLRSASHANYESFGARLRRDIPPSEPAYGTITYWLALRDRPYLSYERTQPFEAAQRFHTRYFILGDRTMSSGAEWDSSFYDQLQQQLGQVVAHSTLVDEFTDPYYGDTRVYKLIDPDRLQTPAAMPAQ